MQFCIQNLLEQGINWYYLNLPCFNYHYLSINALHRWLQEEKVTPNIGRRISGSFHLDLSKSGFFGLFCCIMSSTLKSKPSF